jgi:hypothetical protein
MWLVACDRREALSNRVACSAPEDPGGKKADMLAVYVIAALLGVGLAASVRILKRHERGAASRRTSTLAVPPPGRAVVPEPV